MEKKVIHIKTEPLKEWQKDLVKLVDEHPMDSIIVCKSARQRGKTFALMMIALRQAINHQSTKTVVICPTYQICRKQFKDYKKAVKRIPILEFANSSYFELEFTNGSVIQFKSAESDDNLRGDTAHLLIFDEASFISMETALECFNYTNTTKGDIIIVSTPTFKDEGNLFYKYYKDGMEKKPNIYTIDFCNYDTTSMLSKERMALYKETMPYQIFANEILGEFLEEKSSVFGNFTKVMRNDVMAEGELFAGIDFSTGVNNDETVISVFNSRKQMTNLFHFNDKDAKETIDFIINIFKTLNIRRCVLEVNSMGNVYRDLLKREVANNNIQCQLIDFYTSNKSKRDIIQNLQLMIQNETITLLKDENLKLQFASFEMKSTPSGLITYGNSSDRIHDDIVMATALALSAYNKGTYTVR